MGQEEKKSTKKLSGSKTANKKKTSGSKTANKKITTESKTTNKKIMSGSKTANKKIMSGSKTTNKKIITESKTTTKKITKQPEKWKFVPLKSFKEKYKISNYGRVKNIETSKILKQQVKNGYHYCALNCKPIEQKRRTHRLVALAFVDNPDWDNNDIVNHIDGNKLNNYYENLEWTTIKGNNEHAAKTGLTGKTKRRVTQYEMDGTFKKTYNTVTEAHNETGISSGGIVEACKGKYTHAGNYKWEYTDVNPNEQVIDPEEEGFKQSELFPNYWISCDGRIYSKPFKKFMKLGPHNGALEVQFSRRKDDGTKGQTKKTVRVHNAVGKYFLKRPKNREVNCITHIDGDYTNNHVENLKWIFMEPSKCITDFNF